uniref:Lipid phosphate phosphohydrolase 1 n=1 Tax=Lygus hesperus TaxID=30085 RepID=A0A0A9Y4A7_LYGHE
MCTHIIFVILSIAIVASSAYSNSMKTVKGVVDTSNHILGKADEKFLKGQVSAQDLTDTALYVVGKLRSVADNIKSKHNGKITKSAKKAFKPAERALKTINKHLEAAYRNHYF